MHRRSGVTAQQRMVLRIVGHLGSVSAGMLSTLLHVHPGTLSAALRRLEGRGLLARQRAEDDARRVLIALTPLGERLLATSEGTVERAATQVLSESEPEFISSALLLMEQISRALESRQEPTRRPRSHAPLNDAWHLTSRCGVTDAQIGPPLRVARRSHRRSFRAERV